jgi:hypothetical protein
MVFINVATTARQRNTVQASYEASVDEVLVRCFVVAVAFCPLVASYDNA